MFNLAVIHGENWQDLKCQVFSSAIAEPYNFVFFVLFLNMII